MTILIACFVYTK